jgi:hypothetical protein
LTQAPSATPPPSKEALREALALSEEVLRNLEHADIPLAQAALKAARMAKLMGYGIMERFFQLEATGYPKDGTLDQQTWSLAIEAGRKMLYEDPKTKQKSNRVYIEGAEELEARRKAAEGILSRETTWWGQQNQRTVIETSTRQLATCRAAIHRWVTQSHHALKLAGVADDVFSRTNARVTKLLAGRVPKASEHLLSISENLKSDNPQDWANAVHGCRRLLKEIADAVFPPREPITREINGKTKEIKLGEEQYVNRLVTFAEEHSGSERFNDLVGSNLNFLADRLDSVHSAMNKGTHAEVAKDEADRYVIYTYMLVGDLLSLLPEEK